MAQSSTQLRNFFAALLFGFGAVAGFQANAQEIPKELQEVSINEHLGSRVSIDELNFVDENGKSVKLGDYFHAGRPVVLSLIYYECPNLCNLMLNGFLDTLKTFSWTPGNQFEVVAVSINPRETPALARRKKDAYIQALGKPAAAAGWHFLTGQDDQIKKLASEIGFGYRWEGDQYAHSAAMYVLTPEGRISRYLYGISFPDTTLRLALLEASSGKIGSVVDRILLFCYRYDPQTRKYSVYLTRVMQLVSSLFAMLFGLYLLISWKRTFSKRGVLDSCRT
jgi:protein SCO1/2